MRFGFHCHRSPSILTKGTTVSTGLPLKINMVLFSRVIMTSILIVDITFSNCEFGNPIQALWMGSVIVARI